MMENLGITHSVCSKCLKIVPAKIIAADNKVYFHKFCTEHGHARELIYSDAAQYLHTQRYVKPAWVPLRHTGRSTLDCPHGCGFCSRHEQHLCMPIVEITSRCDLQCPACIADAGDHWDMTVDDFENIIHNLIKTEKQIDVLNLSGGEPLIHPELLHIIDTALADPHIIRVSISTNGLALLNRPMLATELKSRNVVIALQFDGYEENAYERLRGRKLLQEKLEILDLLQKADVSTSLTFTAAHNINTDIIGMKQVLNLLFTTPNIISLMIQPLAFAGRGRHLAAHANRTSIPDIVTWLDNAGEGRVIASDFAPLPCSHPLCFSLAYYLMVEGGSSISLNQLVDASQMMDLLANRTVFGLDAQEQEKMKDLIYQIWSGPAGIAPDSIAVMNTLRGILDSLSSMKPNARDVFLIAERNVKSIFIHAFQDAACFDLSRIRRCCQGYPQPDGTIIPVCVNNVLGRKNKISSNQE